MSWPVHTGKQPLFQVWDQDRIGRHLEKHCPTTTQFLERTANDSSTFTCYVCPAQSTCGEWRLCNPQSLTICVHKMADGEDNTCVDSFEGLKLNGWLVKQCYSVGIKKPTEIQRECVPPILQGRDCIGCAKTGSGKTAAFALPILQKLCEDPYGIFAVVLTPTR